MTPQKINDFLIFMLFVLLSVTIIVMSSTTASASPRNKNATLKNTQSQIKKLTQDQQLEIVYQRLFSELQKKSAISSVDSLSRAKAIKVAYSANADKAYNKRLRVTATAYTSHVGQTDSTPNIAAWGDRLKPGMKAIAVSRDLLKVYGLKHKQKVRIKGLKGEYMVLDKMNKRWRKKIDIYMGMSKRKAFRWGRRKVEINWN